MANFRTIVESKAFVKESQKFHSSQKRFDEALRGVMWILSRKPTLGKPTANPKIWAIFIPPLGEFDSMIVYYSFDEEEVVLQFIKKVV